MPCYREDGAAVQQRLKRAQEHAQYAHHVEIVIVDAGQCRNMQALPHMTGWAHMQVLRFADATGRGPCLNFGAQHARGRILVFCHSDTQLPPGWDVTVRQQFRDHPINGHNVRTSACAFAFDINTTSEGLQGGRRPPGLDAIKLTANLRCRWWKLPYGDQCLCLPATAFAYLGGFPHQCIMEDYELVSLLRLRMTRLGSFSNDGSEHLTILPGPPAACSPRRWQSLGVPYVTVTNSRLVNAYAGGATPEHIYRAYYGHDPIVDAVSPWELKLEQMWANNPAG